MRTIFSRLALAVAASGITFAFAGFRVVGEVPPTTLGLARIDAATGTAARAEGMVKDLPVVQSLQILARGWTVVDARSRKGENQTLAWQGDGTKTWDVVASEALLKANLYAEATWATRTLTLRDPITPAETKITVAPRAEAVPIAAPTKGAEHGPAPMATPVASTASAGAAKAQATFSFDASNGEHLSIALRRFAAANTWSVEWEVPSDFIVKREYSIAGEKFEDVLQRVLADYRLSAVMYGGNRVLAIRESVRKD